MIFIEDLIASDAKCPQTALTHANVIGDAFLFNENDTYRTRRLMAKELKVKFKKADESYNTISLLCLPKILKEKTVPFTENKKALSGLKIPKKKVTAEDLIFLGAKKNHLMHETSHVIMWLIASDKLNLSDPSELMTAYLISESYANYSEVIANMHSDHELHRGHLTLNSFWAYEEKEVRALKSLYKKHGDGLTNAALFLCFLYTNFLYKKISANEAKGIQIFISQINPKTSKFTSAEIKSLFEISSQLNIQFLIKTADIFWKTQGISENIFQKLDFDPIEFLLDRPDLQQNILNLLKYD